MKRKAHNPYLEDVKKVLAIVADGPESFYNHGPRCKRCGGPEKEGFTLQISHVNDDGAQDRRQGLGNAYYKRLYDRAYAEATGGKTLSLELICTGCHGNPKRTDKTMVGSEVEKSGE